MYIEQIMIMQYLLIIIINPKFFPFRSFDTEAIPIYKHGINNNNNNNGGKLQTQRKQ